MPKSSPLPRIWSHACRILAIGLLALPAVAQENKVGGHIGFALPLVTRSGGEWTSLGDNLQLALPMGISVKGPGRLLFDLEFFPVIQDSPRDVVMTLHPGLLWGLGRGFTVGGRVAFVIRSTEFGFTPVLIKSWPIKNGGLFKTYFIEFDFPVRFNRPHFAPSTNSIGLVARIAVGF